jgi:uncharacterized protein
MESVVVAMSGGVDSLLLAKIASDVLGERALAVTADSPSLPRRDLRDAVEIARRLGIQHRVIHSDEVTDRRYRANPANRCYYCKKILFSQLGEIAEQAGARWVCFGENVDDQSDYRPGSQAAMEYAVRAPLREAGLNKTEIRLLAKQLGLPAWDKPASACLASRFPYGTEITPEKLSQVEQAEDYLWRLGFHQCRVRYHGEVARIEVEPEKMSMLLAHAEDINERFRQLGFTYSALDLSGYRRGSLNETIQLSDADDFSILK